MRTKKPAPGKTVGDINITNGAITVAGKPVGRVDQDYKFGCHPCIKLALVGRDHEWIEIDTPNLIDHVFARVAEITAAAGSEA